MSLPRQVPPQSSSPTKSSLRRPGSIGGPPQPQPPVRTLLPSPHFEDDPILASHQSPRPSASFTEDVGIAYSGHALGDDPEESLIQYADEATHGDRVPVLPATFQPFFTLIEDSVSSEHYHPTVYYVFEDDDSDIIAEAACRSLEVLDPSQQSEPSQTHQEEHEPQSRLPPPTPGIHEHYLILDIHPRVTPQQSASQQAQVSIPSSSPRAPTSLIPFHVTSAHSLSAEWQVLKSKVTAAPTIGDGDGDEDEGLMLRIEGRGSTPPGTVLGEKEKEKLTSKETMEDMIERFQRRMDEIRQVLETGVAEE
ncbi:uncharacterized protein A1O9_11454 [Exophiala aquamarina CBS 119918]|uniref:Anaphase-promoting complex subunit 11 RING-H2 finger domain-containing protein n=1 Tax=Exophiala aquamarina CBS 119918 TaxID=1182545 RepID=A0A072NYE5_9EURO|nr:uncharacterized protein A1O9_11454 [Exophiala aquamarina CBS 119918]KEF52611.1 hypothetical protein A1O9_11454 [Exophiala aquamarina CBS 119918]